jgi:hypothetical protein
MATLDKLNRILKAQDDIKAECRTIMDAQSQTDDMKQYMEHQIQLNRLFVQHMELGISASGLLAADSQCPDIELSARRELSDGDVIVRTSSLSDEPEPSVDE